MPSSSSPVFMLRSQQDDKIKTTSLPCHVTRSKSPEKGYNTQSSQLSEDDGPLSQSEEACSQYSQQLHMPTEYLHKIQMLHNILATDLLACDAKWTLFVAAALSYRYDCKLKPCPPRFLQEVTGLQIDALVSVINDTPKLKVVLQYINDQNFDDISLEVIELLHWVLVTMEEPVLHLVKDEEVATLLQTVHGKDIPRKPTFVFAVEASKGFHSHTEFKQRISDYPTKFGFCGQTLDSYFAILHNGFHVDKHETIKLSTDLLTTVKHSPCGAAWGASQCGSLISCTALCEFACDTDLDSVTINARNKSCIDIELKDAHKLRVRYLLFYGCRLSSERHHNTGGILQWLTRHKYCLSLASYLLVLVSIGVANSGTGHTLKLYVGNKILDVLEFCKKFVATE